MRLLGLPLLLIASLGLSGCVNSLHSQQPPAKWTTGFWFWNGHSGDVLPESETLDVLYLHAGTIRKEIGQYAREPWSIDGEFPDQLPAAREYWLVFRYERQQVPDLAAAPILARQASMLLEGGRRRHLNIAGIQLDIDSPTGSLPQYAAFLREVRRSLPHGAEISITALLDWFRHGTAIADVVKEVDEFVPQFYDLGDPASYGRESAIAARFDAAQWGPVFNRFGKRFRIGISTFGRARSRWGESPSRPHHSAIRFLDDLTPLYIAVNSAFNLQTTRNEAEELVLTYRAARKIRIGYNQFEAGETVQFILATPDAVRAAVQSAQRMRGYCAGVVFFRWPASDESLVMQPNEVLTAAGLTPKARRKPAAIHLVDGGCVAVKCVGVYLINANPLFPKLIRYRIRSSTELEYFLPEGNMPVRMAGPSQLELSLPPYCGRGRLYLGRAVTLARAEFTVEGEL